MDGIDLLFIGHSDLTMDLGCYRDFANPVIKKAEKRILAAASRYGKFAGMVLRPGMELRDYASTCMKFICVGTDLGLMQSAFRESLRSIPEK